MVATAKEKGSGKLKKRTAEIQTFVLFLSFQNINRTGTTTIMVYENRKEGTSHLPGRNTVYPPTNAMMKVPASA